MFALSQLAPNRILLWIPLHVNKTSPSLVTTISISTYFAEYPPAYPIPSSFFTIANPVMKANTETVASGDCIESNVTYVDANLIKESFFEAKEWKVEIETITLSSQKNTLPSDTPHNTAFIPDDDLHIFFHGGSLDHRGSCIVHRSSPSSHMKSNPTSLYRKFKTSRFLNEMSISLFRRGYISPATTLELEKHLFTPNPSTYCSLLTPGNGRSTITAQAIYPCLDSFSFAASSESHKIFTGLSYS